jgi:hypothetical protein
MKLSYRQILASAGGAVLSAVIASIFGVKGTIVGVAIGSIAATMGTVLIFQSIERTNSAVKQVVVRVPDSSKLLRRLGGTKAAGVTWSVPDSDSVPHEETGTGTVQAPGSVESATEQIPVPPRPLGPRPNLSWRVIAGTIAGVFVFSLLFLTVVELIAGRPLADLFGHAGGGTTVEKIFESPPTTLPPPTTSTTTSTTTTTSSTSTASSSTTTSVPRSTTSSSNVGSTGATSTTGVSSTSTTTPTTG